MKSYCLLCAWWFPRNKLLINFVFGSDIAKYLIVGHAFHVYQVFHHHATFEVHYVVGTLKSAATFSKTLLSRLRAIVRSNTVN